MTLGQIKKQDASVKKASVNKINTGSSETAKSKASKLAAASGGGRLQVIFKKSGFAVDRAAGKPKDPYEKSLQERLCKEPLKTVFDMGFAQKRAQDTASVAFLRQVAGAFVKALTNIPELEIAREEVEVRPSEEVCEELLLSVPFGIGTEYITAAWIDGMFRKLKEVFAAEIAAYEGTVQLYLTEKSQQLRVPERIFFHLVENKQEEGGYPFAFLSTYATRDNQGMVRHMPLSYALTEYEHERGKLVELLSCLNSAAEASALIGEFMESGELFHPLGLTAAEAYALLRDAEAIEAAGILFRVPNWWKRGSGQVAMQVRLGEEKPSMLGFDALVSMKPELTVDGVALTGAEIRKLLAQTEGLALLKGKWVVVDHARLRAMLDSMEKYEGSVTLLQALRMETGIGKTQDIDVGPLVTNGKWLGTMFAKLRQPAGMRGRRVPATVKATLRPYQKWQTIWVLAKHCRSLRGLMICGGLIRRRGYC